MSNGEVKRFKFINGVGNWSYEEAVLASDHERIVAELKASIEHSETKVGWLLHDNEKNVRERDAVIAKQAKVIDELKYALRSLYDDDDLVSKQRIIEEAFEEIEAIEKREGT